MNTITMQDLKTKGSKAIPDELTYLIVNSKVKSAIIPVKEYHAFMNALEELYDSNIVEERQKEESEPFTELYE